MLKELTVPEVAENVEEGKVVSFLVQEGQKVEEDQSLLEMETDKAVVAIPSTMRGKLVEFLVEEGDSLEIGDVFAKIETGAEKEEASETEKPEDEAESKEPAEDDSEGDGKGEAREASRAAIDKVTSSTEHAEGHDEEDDAERERRQVEQREEDSELERRVPGATDVAPASPVVRRLARELGVSVDDVTGTGARGRITEQDVHDHVRRLLQGGPPPGQRERETAPAGPALPDFSRWGDTRREELPTVRRLTAETVTRSWTTIPAVAQRDVADVTEIEAFRKRYDEARADGEPKLTLTAILLKVCAVALREFPRFNSSVDWHERELVWKEYVNVGVAVDTERGLLVPVIRDADRKGISQLVDDLAAAAERARSKKIDPSELEGGNFTISNLGGIGGTSFDPIILPPQVAILGVDRASMQPVWTGDSFVPRLQLPLTLVYDHRAIDGAEGARFLRWICEAIEQPLLVSMKGGRA